MNRRITDYIQRNRGTYTDEAIRQTLLKRGHDPEEIDEGLRAVAAGEVPTSTRLGQSFWLWFIGSIVVLYGLTLLWFMMLPSGYQVVPFLGIVLAIAAGVSILLALGNSPSTPMSTRSNVVVAFTVPLVLLFLVAGSCYALTAPSLLQSPPRNGQMDIEIDAPLAFTGSGPAVCQVQNNASGFSVYAQHLGTIGGRIVTASFNSFTPPVDPNAPAPAPADPNAPAPAPGPTPGPGAGSELFVSLEPSTEAGQYLMYAPRFDSRVEIDAAPDRLTGTVEFGGLTSESGDPAAPAGAPETISGRFSWDCE